MNPNSPKILIRNNLVVLLSKDKDATLSKLADKVGVSRQYMSLIANEKKVPRPELMFLIAQKLGLAFGDVWYLEDNHKGISVDGS